MRFTGFVRQHWAALRALLVFTVVLGIAYPLLVWLIGQLPGLQQRAQGSLITVDGQPVASELIGQSFTDDNGLALPQYFQTRPSAAGDGYDGLASSASNLGPEDIVDQPEKPSLLTQVCARSLAIEQVESLQSGAGLRPFCTPSGVGAVLAVFGPRSSDGTVVHPSRVVSINEVCGDGTEPFVLSYRGVRVECARADEDYSAGQVVPIRGAAPKTSRIPADAVTASGSGLDPDISPEYAALQIDRVARARGISADQVRAVLRAQSRGRLLGFFGEPRVNVVVLNWELDRKYPVP